MAAKHTPGPWYPEKSSAEYWYITTSPDPFGPLVAQTWCEDPKEHEATARLIAAAPRLLAAASAWVRYMDDPSDGDHDLEDTILDELRAAIAKATGQDATQPSAPERQSIQKGN